jgi:uncharacterized protein (TIGR02421 family)
MMNALKDFEHFRELDRELVSIAKNVKILSYLSWPVELAERFLEKWRAGDPELPVPPSPRSDLGACIEPLERLARPAADHPVARFIARTAESYLHSARLLGHIGTPTFTEISVSIYGRPEDEVGPGGLTNLAAAESLLRTTEELSRGCADLKTVRDLSAANLQMHMSRVFGDFFTKDDVKVVVDPNLASKAAAGAEKIRIRAGASFSQDDLNQLIQHEGFVHTATSLNGRAQPHLTCLSLNAPRTTATQEGIATFAEFITNSIDLNRLRRLALRIKGIHMALEGADFIEVFKYFHESGQSERESYFSTARVFRGGDPKGAVVFTKDVVYLRGLFKTQTFLLTALQQRKIQYTQLMFCGRLTWGDVQELEPFYESGLIVPPRYRPAWIQNQNALAAYLTFSNLTHHLPIQQAELSDFMPPVHKIGTTKRWSLPKE